MCIRDSSSAIPLSAMVVFVYSTLESDDSQQEQKVVDFLEFLVKICYAHDPVSYTHLDVYKRQVAKDYSVSGYDLTIEKEPKWESVSLPQ